MIFINGVKIEPTRFPDGTTQAWRIPDLKVKVGGPPVVIDWRFEREEEFFTVAQLRALMGMYPCVLRVPYLPYARQDKEIDNDATFALRPFARLLNSLEFDRVVTWDAHNPVLTKKLIPALVNVEPMALQLDLVKRLGIKTVIYPDAGASARYSGYYTQTGTLRVIYQKKRDQATGKIMGIERQLKGKVDAATEVPPGPCLIVDDICDGGATFLGIEESMKDEGIRGRDLHLFVTHGIFSKGRKVLEDAGIKLWTTNSLPRNADEMPLEDGLPYRIERKDA